MIDWFLELSALDRGFAISAVAGLFLLAVRLVLMTLGGIGDADVDGGDDFDVDHADASDASFRIVSLQGLMSFFLMFGLVGLGLSQQLGWIGILAFLGAFVAGTAAMLIIGLVYLLFDRMQSSGTVRMANAVGAEGVVYLTIPAGGTGQIQVTVQGRMRTEDAVADADRDLPTGTRVRVSAVRGSATLVVTPVDNELNPSTAQNETTNPE